MAKERKINISALLDVSISDLAEALFQENEDQAVLDLIECIDNRFATMEFSQALFVRLAESIAIEGEDACDMEGIVAESRKAAQ